MQINTRKILVISVTTAAVIILLFWLLFDRQDSAGQKELEFEISKALLQFFFVGVIGGLGKLLFDAYQVNRRKQDNLKEFRADKIRRLVEVTNIIRQAPILIAAHSSAKTYIEQMRRILDAAMELKLIKHEISALGSDEHNPAFPSFPYIRECLVTMENYLLNFRQEFIDNSDKLSEKQVKAENAKGQERTELRHEIKREIESLSWVADLLTNKSDSNLNAVYFSQYQEVLNIMIGDAQLSV